MCVGAVGAATFWTLGPLLASALAVTVGLLITGAFHEDGLADVADAFGGGWTQEERREILKDTHHGTYAVAAMVASIGLRVVALASMGQGAAILAAAVAAHTLARTAALAALGVFPPAVESGLGADTARDLNPGLALTGLAAGLAVAAVAVGWWAIPSTIAAGWAMVAVGWLAMRKIGGIAGDVLGAIEQVAEIAVLITIVGLTRRFDLWWE